MAADEGGSWICPDCGGAIALRRKEAHAQWCGAGSDSDESGGGAAPAAARGAGPQSLDPKQWAERRFTFSPTASCGVAEFQLFVRQWFAETRGELYSCVWEACLLFCDWLCARPEVVRGRRVLELGAGLGVPACVAAQLGAAEVVATDITAALPGIARTVADNALHSSVGVLRGDWRRDRATIADYAADVVVGCDVVAATAYGDVANDLLATLSACLAARPDALVLIIFQPRLNASDRMFFDGLRARFTVTESDLPNTRDSVGRFLLYEVRRRKLGDGGNYVHGDASGSRRDFAQNKSREPGSPQRAQRAA